MKRIIGIALAVIGVLYGLYTGKIDVADLLQGQDQSASAAKHGGSESNAKPAAFVGSAAEDGKLARAIANQQSDVQVRGTGKVIKLLRDDNKGHRHQKFLIRIDGGNTLLIAHNIDLAPRIDSLREGDSVEFYGEFEWNDRGGVVHWTHHDPGKRHIDGYLKHNGRTYQ